MNDKYGPVSGGPQGQGSLPEDRDYARVGGRDKTAAQRAREEQHAKEYRFPVTVSRKERA